MYFVRHRSHNCFLLYEVLLPTLKSADVPGSGAGHTTPQRAGTCYAKCMFFGSENVTCRSWCVQGRPKALHVQFSCFLLGKDGGRS